MHYLITVFNTTDFGDPNDAKNYLGPDVNTSDEFETCRYRGYRGDPGEKDQYKQNEMWLHVFTARLGFIVIFEHLVLLLKIFLAYVIPDAPNNLRDQLQRERQNLREAQFQRENRENPLLSPDQETRRSSIDENINEIRFRSAASKRCKTAATSYRSSSIASNSISPI